MTHDPHCQEFQEASQKALKDDQLQELLNRTLKSGFQKKRLTGMARCRKRGHWSWLLLPKVPRP